MGSVGLPFPSIGNLLTSQRARATSAAPRFFKPFVHEESGNIFSDGALNYNNPIEVAEYERKMLWPDHLHPDLLLSLGTGGEPKEEIELEPDVIAQRGLVGYLKRLKAIVAHQNKFVMNSELAWENFRGRKALEKMEDRAYIRLSMEMDEPPRIDEVEKLDFLIKEATRYAESHEGVINDTVTKLIASLFYVRLDEAQADRQEDGQRHLCKGLGRMPLGFPVRSVDETTATILCRLDADSVQLRKLCQKIENSNYSFSVRDGDRKTKKLGKGEMLNEDRMFALNIEFSVSSIAEPIRIYLSTRPSRRRGEPDTGQLISGFPCSLDQLRKLSK